MPPSESRIFRRSANDYYHSRSKGFRDFRSPYHDYSGYGAVSAGRLELQSYVARDGESPFFGNSFISGECRPRGVSTLDIRGGTGSGPLATKDELNMIKYESQEHEFLHGLSHKGNYHHHGHDLSHIGHDLGEHSRYDHRGHEISYIGHHGEQYSYVHNGHGISHGGQQTPSHHYGGDDQYNDSDKVSAYEEDDDDEGDGGPAKSIGLLGLFKYSTKWDLFLVILGCLGALINGGSLPWYFYLFGEFVNKIAIESSNREKGQMMKDVEKVHNFLYK